MASVDGREVLGGVFAVTGRVRHAVLSSDHGGHALAQQRERDVGVAQQAVGVGVRVDESRKHQAPRDVDHLVARTRVDATDLRHGLGLDRDVGAPEAGPVDHGATTEDYPVLHCSPQK